jgi:hypothetical protein
MLVRGRWDDLKMCKPKTLVLAEIQFADTSAETSASVSSTVKDKDKISHGVR